LKKDGRREKIIKKWREMQIHQSSPVIWVGIIGCVKGRIGKRKKRSENDGSGS